MGQVISAAFPTIIEAIKGCVGLNESVEDLETQVNQLTNQLVDLQTKLTNLEGGGKRRRKQEVVSWIEQATKLTKDFPPLKERTLQGQWWEKYLSIDRVKKMSEAVEDVKNDLRNIGELTVVDVDESTIPSLVVSQLFGKTSNDNLDKLYGWLEDDKVSSIGVYGMGGVGKTTLVKHIHNRILQKMSGVKVYWVTVSQDFSIKKLQDDIAKIAGLQFLDENEEHRAAILHQHLEGEKTVLILDDVWKCIRLEKLGNPHRIEGCKFIITSRSLQVCHQIECQELFKVNILNENEAWDLFKENLLLHGHTVLTNAIEKHAKELAKKCGGLPLALNTVAASMRGVYDDHIWRNAINNFQNDSLQLQDLENNVFEILKFSYDRLNDQRLKECFLYCCLYPEDWNICKDEVIMKLMGEGLCEDTDEGHSILNKLVDVFLLEGVEMYVKMHDLMREMALKISKFMVKSDLTEIPEKKHWIAELERVSFMRSKIKEIPDGFSPRCHSLSTLILQNYVDNFDPPLQRIPESFLLHMRTHLRVLDLSYNNWLECLPNSISDLENLYGLYLEDCKRISCLPGMKKLKKLMVLNIEGCYGIRELPQDMGCLVNLQYLYMRRTNKYLEIPKGVIAKLRNLRCFRLDYYPSLKSEELNCLTHLQEFTNGYDDLHSFNNITLVKKLEQLKCYQISVGCYCTEPESEERSVCFIEINFEGKRCQEVKVLLPANICRLRIHKCDGLYGCILDYFQSMSNNLSELFVSNSLEAEWIWDSEQIIENAVSNTGATPFKCPETLYLKTLQRLVSLFKGEDVIILPDCTFSSLKHLYIIECESMKKLLSQALLQNLQNLEILQVQWCKNLEVVIGVGDEEGSSNTQPSSSSNISCLPKLKHLRLGVLPKLKSICNGREMVCPSIEIISILHCQNIKRMPSLLPIDEASQQPYLPSSFQDIHIIEKEWWDSLEWHNPNEKDILESHIKWYPLDKSDSDL